MEYFQSGAFGAVNDLNIDNAAGAMMAIIFVDGLVGVLLISCSILIPLIIPLFSNLRASITTIKKRYAPHQIN